MADIDDLLIDDKVNNNSKGKSILDEKRGIDNSKWDDNVRKLQDVRSILKESINDGIINADQASNIVNSVVGKLISPNIDTLNLSQTSNENTSLQNNSSTALPEFEEKPLKLDDTESGE
jgi:hypothetical protein